MSMNSQLRTKLCIGYFYAMEGFINGLFAALLPQMKKQYALDHEMVGAVLMVCTLGSLMAVPILETDFMSHRLGSRNNLMLSAFLYCAMVNLLFCANSTYMLIAISWVWGIVYSCMTISCLSQATLYERAYDTSAMGFFTVIYAVGEMSGTGFAGGLYYFDVSALSISVYGSCVFAFLNLIFVRHLFSNQAAYDINKNKKGSACDSDIDDAESLLVVEMKDIDVERHDNRVNKEKEVIKEIDELEEGNTLHTVNTVDTNTNSDSDSEDTVIPKNYIEMISLISIGAMSYCLQGSVSAWAGIYLLNQGSSKSFSVVGIWVFTLGTAISCSIYDHLISSKFITKKNMLYCSATACVLGFFIVSASSALPPTSSTFALMMSTFGFFVVGLFASPLTPIATSASSSVRGFSSAQGAALVAGYSNIGLLVGPPLLGVVAQASGAVMWSFVTAGLMSALIVPLALKLNID